MGSSQNKKSDIIRELLLKTLGKNPDLFSYYVSIMEAKELLGKFNLTDNLETNKDKPFKLLGEG